MFSPFLPLKREDASANNVMIEVKAKYRCEVSHSLEDGKGNHFFCYKHALRIIKGYTQAMLIFKGVLSLNGLL
jgi:hypothetical protein